MITLQKTADVLLDLQKQLQQEQQKNQMLQEQQLEIISMLFTMYFQYAGAYQNKLACQSLLMKYTDWTPEV